MRYFTVLADELHFVRAAERLGIPQPALSQQIRRLERIVGCTLIQRRPRVELTAAGEIFLTGSKRIVDDIGCTVERVRRAARGETGSLFVGVVASTLLIPAITNALRSFTSRHPQVRLEVVTMDTADQLQGLKTDRIDLAIARDPPKHSWLRSLPLLREPLVFALPAGHVLVRKRKLQLIDLAEDPFVFFSSRVNPGIHGRILDACRKAGFEPAVAQEVDDVQARLGLVAAGMGWTIVAASVAAANRPDVVFRPMEGSSSSTLVALCTFAERPLSPTAAHLARILADEHPNGVTASSV